jgi:hypothetical protein
MSRRLFAASALLCLCILAPCTARAALDATPFVGAMIPANSQLLVTSGSSYIRMQTHTVYGLMLSCPLKDKIGGELVLGTGTGKMEIVGGSTALPLASTLFMVDLRGRMRLLGTERSHLAGVLGVGYTDFNSGLFDLAHETDQGTFIGRLTGIVGAEIHGDLTDQAHLNIGLVDRIHDAGVGLSSGLDGSEKTQNDLVATAGLSFSL